MKMKVKMKVGDLVRRKQHSHHKTGLILKARYPKATYMWPDSRFYVHWFEINPSEERHEWFHYYLLETVSESR